ncbi:MAG TPA: tetratricopeptide repeat protein [Cyclobacteriaceae bacterium]|nr:tetratricopeptide repeat protein [Cyclobacteriaceae bacterium]
MRKLIVLSLPLLVIFGCGQKQEEQTEKAPEVVSLLGKTFYEPERSPEAQARLDSNLQVAEKNFLKDPSEENYIWYARRLGYLSRFNDAIEILSQGLEKYPDSYRLLRHRGHRYISMRLFDRAIDDLTRASQLMPPWPPEIEPDGAPNKMNIPLSSTQFNIWYHLGLAHYLKGDFEKAEQAYIECLKVSNNDDLLVATIDWFYMTYRREGKDELAKGLLGNITDSMNIIENDSYYKRLQMYQGKLQPEQLLTVDPEADDYDLSLATQGYGVGNWYLYNGDTTKAIDIFEKVVAGKSFASFGFIAAEAELARE